MSEILNEQTVQRLWPRDENDADTATIEHVAMLCDSHEALRAENTRLSERVASLEAALRKIAEWDRNVSLGYEGPRDVARAALGDQVAPTEPEVCECGWIHRDAAPQVAPTEPPSERTDAERLADLNALRAAEGNRPLDALPPDSSWADAERVIRPQVAPEPERCPADCEDGWRFNTGNAADPGEWVKCKNAWHRPEPERRHTTGWSAAAIASRPAPLAAPEPERLPLSTPDGIVWTRPAPLVEGEQEREAYFPSQALWEAADYTEGNEKP